ncbi:MULTISPECIES: histidine phosphatase family protein [unclassified Isoptericola]|uniref:histidine phosphatase family protein n=1 Tax=unclassified Isoptericola TaxID=2623355 RepID=UPI00271402E6|nr:MULTISPECIES: histidine phosphatase family protein [unclassified Isoptericola]MDO8145411.1 histidine phosphatase family protein [Isoptericola sp. 178]MDO8149052.1 histidine phosphatase family protein [Isoptericola sp. b515]MDO8151008.1 histidine phosphatase family protein [Isoptericola sp. b408]
MTARTVVLLRHGRTAYNATMRLQGQVDIPLDEVGRWQAEQGATALATSHRAARVVSSDLERAADTAAAYAELMGLPVETDPRLRERSFGQWEGLTQDEIVDRWPEEYATWRRGGEPRGVDAETKAEVAARTTAAVRDHADLLDGDECLVVVSHGAAISLAITGLLDLDATAWRGISGMHNVHWSHLHRSAPGAVPGWRLVAHNVGAGYPLDRWQAGPHADLEPEPKSA